MELKATTKEECLFGINQSIKAIVMIASYQQEVSKNKWMTHSMKLQQEAIDFETKRLGQVLLNLYNEIQEMNAQANANNEDKIEKLFNKENE